MKRNILILLGFSLLLIPNLVLADCVDVSRTTSYYIQGAHDVILYYRLTPLAYISVPWCNILSDSSVLITKGYLCDSDKILIDGQACDIFSLKSSSSTY
jgi:hypothetical protein